MIIICVKAVKMFFRHSRLLVIQLWVSDASVDVNSQPPHPFSVSLSALSLEVCVCIAHMASHKTHTCTPSKDIHPFLQVLLPAPVEVPLCN